MERSYLTKEVASKRSGRSVRRLLELAAAGRIRKRIIRDPAKGNRELTLFHAGDIDLLAKGKLPPAAPAPSAALEISGPVRPVAALPQGEAASIAPRPWLTIAEAADYTGLPAAFLYRMIVDRKLPALDVGQRRGGRWRVARRDLDSISAGADEVPKPHILSKLGEHLAGRVFAPSFD